VGLILDRGLPFADSDESEADSKVPLAAARDVLSAAAAAPAVTSARTAALASRYPHMMPVALSGAGSAKYGGPPGDLDGQRRRDRWQDRDAECHCH
jgi:hypothetical protein